MAPLQLVSFRYSTLYSHRILRIIVPRNHQQNSTMAAAPCEDSNHVVTEWANYAYEIIVLAPGACGGNRRRCAKTNSINHRDAAGNPINPFDVCLACQLVGSRITNRNRKPITAPPAAPFHIRARGRLLRGGPNSAWNRGRLCDSCIDYEIVEYYKRRFIGRRKTPARAANTCKCEKELRKHYCVKDRIAAYTKIQESSDRNAGQGGWLEHIDYQAATNRARYFNPNGALLARRAAAGCASNACRCGKDMRLLGAGHAYNVPVPVAACTACSGVIVDVTHDRVINFVDAWPDPTGEDAPNMDYGRTLH